MRIKYKKDIEIPVKKVSELGKLSGLMFRTKETKNLLFQFKNKTRLGIHSFFVMFPFLAVWTDKSNQVIEFRVVKSFSPVIRPKKAFTNLIEIPFNNKNKKIVEFFVGEGKV